MPNPIVDEIVDEVRRARDEYARRFQYDVAAMCHDLQEKRQLAEVPVVRLPSRPVSTDLVTAGPRVTPVP